MKNVNTIHFSRSFDPNNKNSQTLREKEHPDLR